MAFSTFFFTLLLFSLVPFFVSAHSPAPAPATSPTHSPPKVLPLPPIAMSHPPAIAPTTTSPPATAIVPPPSIANPPESNPPPAPPSNGVASNNFPHCGYLAPLLFVVAMTMHN
ncbi:unnamed protein product [Citrullus colocynthis]|uniref:Uncharacterized protein n=1 Tax=Citrullus colocynthis TaxID=252529 RepID=A0ABP0XY20_9ROSI